MTSLRRPLWVDRVDAIGPWVAIALLGGVLALGVRSTIGVVGKASWVDHTHRAIECIDGLQLNLSRAVVARRGYALTGDIAESATYTRAMLALTEATRLLRALTADNPSQQHRLDAFEPLVAIYVLRWDAAFEYRRAHGFDAVHEAGEVRYGANAYRDLLERAAELVNEEQRLLVTREQQAEEGLAQTRTLEIVGACFGLILVTVVIVRLRREVQRRKRSEVTVLRSEHALSELNQVLERRIESRTAQLKTANDELESFSYSLIHDLRAPLRGMGSFADLLLDEHKASLDPDALECLGEIRSNARKMARLIDALDAMSRIVRAEITHTDVDVSAMVRIVTAQLGEVEPRTTLEIIVREGLRVDGDVPLVRILIEELVGNAHKFAGGIAMPRIEAGEAAVDGERVLFVRDNGAGFDMAHYDKLFTPFGRLHTLAEFPGVGIGLAIAQRIVRRHGGRIWADGQVGLGATFYFTLGPRTHKEPS